MRPGWPNRGLTAGLLILAATGFLLGVVLVPWLESSRLEKDRASDQAPGEGRDQAEAEGGRSGSPSLLRLVYRPLCHQQADRCLDLGSGPLVVCARCSGLYLGGWLGIVAAAAVIWCGRRPPCLHWRWLVLAAAPSLIDVAIGILGLGGLSSWPRFAVAMVPGLLCGLLLTYAVDDLVAGRKVMPEEDSRSCVPGGEGPSLPPSGRDSVQSVKAVSRDHVQT